MRLWHFVPMDHPNKSRIPVTPLLDTALLTNAPREPRIGSQLASEIPSADRIDAVIAFIRRSGIRPLLDSLRHHCEAGRPLRVLTTTYTGSTEPLALDDLIRVGAQVRVSYDNSSTRLARKGLAVSSQVWIFNGVHWFFESVALGNGEWARVERAGIGCS